MDQVIGKSKAENLQGLITISYQGVLSSSRMSTPISPLKQTRHKFHYDLKSYISSEQS